MTIKLLRAAGENPLCYFCQSTSCCIILIKQRCTQFSFLRPCKTICAQQREESEAGLSAASTQEDLEIRFLSTSGGKVWRLVGFQIPPELLMSRFPSCTEHVHAPQRLNPSVFKTLVDSFSLQDNSVVAFFFFSLESSKFAHKKKKWKNESKWTRSWSCSSADSQLISTSHWPPTSTLPD